MTPVVQESWNTFDIPLVQKLLHTEFLKNRNDSYQGIKSAQWMITEHFLSNPILLGSPDERAVFFIVHTIYINLSFVLIYFHWSFEYFNMHTNFYPYLG
jgi:hypothetical protein